MKWMKLSLTKWLTYLRRVEKDPYVIERILFIFLVSVDLILGILLKLSKK